MFAQDEIRTLERLRVMFGAKVERETLSGWGVQPTARAVWTLARSQADVNVETRASERLSVVVSGRDLLSTAVAEYPSWTTGMRTTSTPRSASVQLVWRK